jgi:hypothetical protein
VFANGATSAFPPRLSAIAITPAMMITPVAAYQNGEPVLVRRALTAAARRRLREALPTGPHATCWPVLLPTRLPT